ncbi:hypothetical protein HMPREF9145_1401 [Segatella salivae F0493]|uniref:Uncharacterized protein n=1 Tax=Segatella salivae F0493 TaxID=1395125 RepID=U2L104_9BACT|nr:hypothetical protein HMPREF9145_1401 [Segatella salivae F0493]
MGQNSRRMFQNESNKVLTSLFHLTSFRFKIKTTLLPIRL